MSGSISAVSGVNDDTRMRAVSNPSCLKRASGDSSSGVDISTLKALSEYIAVNYLPTVPLTVSFQEEDPDKILRNSLEKSSSIDTESRAAEKRSDLINELALNMKTGDAKGPDKMNSVGDLLCELMILMIKSTSERKLIERELGTMLVVANLERSKGTAGLKKVAAQISAAKFNAWMNFGAVAAKVAVGEVMSLKTKHSNKKNAKTAFEAQKATAMDISRGKTIADNTPFKYQASFADISAQQMSFKKYGDMAQSIMSIFLESGPVGEVGMFSREKVANLDALIQESNSLSSLSTILASKAQDAVKSAEAARQYFIALMSQISNIEKDGAMQVIRNI